jgi:cytochrome c-type biogenesis protein CcmH/NrfG
MSMRRIGIGVLAAALVAGGASAQSEMEQVQQAGDRLLSASREDLQQNAQLASQALRNKDFKTARKYAEAVTRGDPKRVESWLLLGAAQIGLQDWKRARGTYTTAVRVGPGNAEAHAGLGVAYARTNDPKAQAQLAWLGQAASACGSCWQAADLAKFRGSVEAAIAIAAAPAGAGPPGT